MNSIPSLPVPGHPCELVASTRTPSSGRIRVGAYKLTSKGI